MSREERNAMRFDAPSVAPCSPRAASAGGNGRRTRFVPKEVAPATQQPAAGEEPPAPPESTARPGPPRYPDVPTSIVTGPTSPLKRWIDVGVGGLMAGILWPVFAMAALLIAIESPGPVLIKQPRVGLNGRQFYFLKFRSMRHRKRRDDLADRLPTGDLTKRLLSPKGRPRDATAIGWTLRKTTVDELPQLLNVVRGDMSLVGPRPDIPQIVDAWPPEFRQRHLVKPGMTGLAQVNGRSDLTHYEKVRYDLRYVAHHPLSLDLRILMETVRLVISKKGAR